MRKRLLSAILAGSMMLSMAACGGGASSSSSTTPTSDAGSASAPAATPAPDAAAPAGDASSAAADTTGNDGIVVGVILKTLASEYWGYVVAGVQAAEKDLGVKVILQGAASETAFDEQLNMVETMLSAGEVQAMAISPLQPDMIATKIADAKIPILAVDTKIPADNVLTFIGTGNEDAGYMGGKYVAEKAGAGCKAVIISGVQGDLTAEARIAGYKKGIEEGGGEVMSVQYADAVADKAVSVMENFLQTYDKIDAVLCNNDDMAMAASRAAKQAGREGIIFCGFDGISSGVQAIIDGNETCSVAQDPYMMGYKAVELSVKAIKGETIDEFTDTGCSIIDQSNAAEYLDKLNKMLGK